VPVSALRHCRARLGFPCRSRRLHRTPLVHTREHLLVASDHWDDHRAPKRLKFVVAHLQGQPHFPEGLVTRFLWQQRQIPAELGKGKCLVQLVHRPVSLIEKRFRVYRNGFCNGSHRVLPMVMPNVAVSGGRQQSRFTGKTTGGPTLQAPAVRWTVMLDVRAAIGRLAGGPSACQGEQACASQVPPHREMRKRRRANRLERECGGSPTASSRTSIRKRAASTCRARVLGYQTHAALKEMLISSGPASPCSRRSATTQRASA